MLLRLSHTLFILPGVLRWFVTLLHSNFETLRILEKNSFLKGGEVFCCVFVVVYLVICYLLFHFLVVLGMRAGRCQVLGAMGRISQFMF